MSGFAFNPPSSILATYNPSLFANASLTSYLTYNDAALLYLPKVGGTINFLNCTNNLNIISGSLQLNGVSANLTALTGIVNGTASASRALITDANIDIGSLRNLTATGTLSGATLAVTGTSINLSNPTTINNTCLWTAGGIPSVGNGLNIRFSGVASSGYIRSYNFQTSSDNNLSINSENIYVSSNRRIGIDCSTTPAYKLDVAGDINTSTGYRVAGVLSDLSSIAGVTAGTAQASKALITSASNNIGSINLLQCSTLNSNADLSINGQIFLDNTNQLIGIGTATPHAKIDFLNSTSSTFRLSYTSNAIYSDLYCNSAGTLVLSSPIAPTRLNIIASAPLAYITAQSSGAYPDASYDKLMLLEGSNPNPVQFLVECSNNTSATTTNACFVGTQTVSDLRIGTGNSTKMTIQASNGYVGIATSTPAYPLSVMANVSSTVDVANAGSCVLGFANNSIVHYTIAQTGINISGNFSSGVLASAIWTQSDRRLKEHIRPLPAGIADAMLEVEPRSFRLIGEPNEQVGYIAQDLLGAGLGSVLSMIPDADLTETIDDNGLISPAGIRFEVQYDRVVCLLHMTVLKQAKRIETLERDVVDLKDLLDEHANMIHELREDTDGRVADSA
jgi:hypothetical protein